jgi:hypothetical protein
MTIDQNKKTLRHFQCRDYLWEIFEQMSAELECSTDYLINEAMRQYARSRNYGTTSEAAGASGTTTPQVQKPQIQEPAKPIATIPSMRASPMARGSLPPPPPPRSRRPSGATPSGAVPSIAPPPPVRPSIPSSAQQAAMPSIPPPLPSRAPAAPMAQAARTTLYVIFNGQKIPVNKDEFVIGRGSKSADLAIKDGNISRRHAAVVFQNGGYYMKDLGSTNGVEFEGQRVDSKLIEEGDHYRLCDYDLRFTYQ